MSIQVLPNVDVELFQGPAGAATLNSMANTTPILEGATIPFETSRQCHSGERGGGCARGIRWAIGIEASFALAVYVGWHLWNVFR